MAIPKWIAQRPNGVLVKFHVQPNASRSEISGEHGDRLKVRIAAPPADGAANEALIDFLKALMGLPLSNFELVRGQTSRGKDVLFLGQNIDEVFAKLK